MLQGDRKTQIYNTDLMDDVSERWRKPSLYSQTLSHERAMMLKTEISFIKKKNTYWRCVCGLYICVACIFVWIWTLDNEWWRISRQWWCVLWGKCWVYHVQRRKQELEIENSRCHLITNQNHKENIIQIKRAYQQKKWNRESNLFENILGKRGIWKAEKNG